MKDDLIILRRLKTRDGIVSDIKELAEYRRIERRVLEPQHKVATRVEEMGFSNYEAVSSREYVEVRRVQAILIEMEEV